MSIITKKLTVGLVSIAFVCSLVAVGSATAASDDTIESLQAQIAQLLQQIQGLQSTQGSGSSVGSTSTYSGGSAACSFTWTRNLSMGSTGDDVRQLQRFLNGNPQTQVAVSGAGSPGNESSYYGPATARAVSKFQELHAAQILTPLGLTKGTGGFYTSTRRQLNSVCQSGSSGVFVGKQEARTATTSPIVRVTGDALAVTPGNPISDSYVVEGAQRAPFTSVVLTAGSDDVRIESIRIKRFGLSSSDNFESVAVVDANGVQIGNARSINSRDEVSLGSNFVVPSGRSVTLAIVGNMTTGSDFKSGAIAGLEIAEVVADATVQGRFPIRGAAHVLSDSVDLQTVVVDVGGGGGSIEFGKSEEVASINVELDGSGADEEDAYLRSIILEQVGTADSEEIGDLEVYVDNDKVNHSIAVSRDRYIINFSGKGVMIEEGDDVEISIETETDRGYEETVQFRLDDMSDLYVLGASYGYGLPVQIEGDTDGDGKVDSGETWENQTDVARISSGKVADGDRLRKFDDEVRYDNDVILGALSVKFEGEDVEMEDLMFKVDFDGFAWSSETDNAWEDADEDTVRIDSVRLRVDGENVAYADDSIDFDEPTTASGGNDAYRDDGTTDRRVEVEFDNNFVIDVRQDREVKFEIVGDLNEAWSHFDGATLEFTLVSLDTAEGVNSEKDYKASGEFFADEIDFRYVEIVGNEIDIEISRQGANSEFVTGSDDVVFGTLEIDASDTVDDIDPRDLYISFQVDSADVGDLDDINNCRILDEGGDEVADTSRDLTGSKRTGSAIESDQARFRFDDYTVESGESVDLSIVCDVDDDALAGDKYQIKADTTEEDRLEYRIGRDDYTYDLTSGDASRKVTVSASGTLSVKVDSPDNETDTVIAVGGGLDGVEALDIRLEAEDEDISVIEVYLDGVALGVGTDANGTTISIGESELEKIMDRITLEFPGDDIVARPNDFSAGSQSIVHQNGDCLDSESSCSETDDVAFTVAANSITFEKVEKAGVIDAGDEDAVKLTIDYGRIDDDVDETRSGNWLKAANLIVVYEGEQSGHVSMETKALAGEFRNNVVFPTVPTISVPSQSGSEDDLANGTRKLYEFTITADKAGPVYVKKVSFTPSLSSGVTVTGAKVKRGGSTVSSPLDLNDTSTAAEFVFTDAEEIRAGQSETFAVEGTVAGVTDNSSITMDLTIDSGVRTVAGSVYDTGLGSFVWSPNTLDLDEEVGSTNKDWFSGWGLYDSDDVRSWTLNR